MNEKYKIEMDKTEITNSEKVLNQLIDNIKKYDVIEFNDKFGLKLSESEIDTILVNCEKIISIGLKELDDLYNRVNKFFEKCSKEI